MNGLKFRGHLTKGQLAPTQSCARYNTSMNELRDDITGLYVIFQWLICMELLKIGVRTKGNWRNIFNFIFDLFVLNNSALKNVRLIN